MSRIAHGRSLRIMLAMTVAMGLTACEEGKGLNFLKPRGDGVAASAGAERSTKLVERDVEAPEVFQATEAGLWDGRPSLGGVWVAHPDVKDPERVIIRNEQNGKFVIGALFRRERETPGPRLQVSSEAAAALGMLAGQPTNLNVVALRREDVAEELPAPMTDAAAAQGAETAELAPPAAIASGEIDSLASTAAAAIDSAPAPAAAPAPGSAPKPAAGTLDKPYIQIGIFSVEANADNTATAMRQAGMVPTVKKQSSSGKTFWRVLVGPAQTRAEIDTLLKKIKDAGFTDAYAVSN